MTEAADDLLGLRGRAALVVGGGQGIGRASALLLARVGCRVGVVDAEAERARAVAGELAAAGAGQHAVVADVTLPDEAARAVADGASALGGLDVLVNIVGGASWAPLLEMDEATWERDLQLNLTQHWYIARAAASRMIEAGTGGSLVFVASVSGLFSAARHAAYGAAKAGLLALTRSMAEEWWPRGIRVNAVVPGAVRTPRIEGAWERGEIRRPGPEVERRMALPEDIASAALFLASDLARKVTGQGLVVDGGSTTRFPF